MRSEYEDFEPKRHKSLSRTLANKGLTLRPFLCRFWQRLERFSTAQASPLSPVHKRQETHTAHDTALIRGSPGVGEAGQTERINQNWLLRYTQVMLHSSQHAAAHGQQRQRQRASTRTTSASVPRPAPAWLSAPARLDPRRLAPPRQRAPTRASAAFCAGAPRPALTRPPAPARLDPRQRAPRVSAGTARASAQTSVSAAPARASAARAKP